MQLRSSQGAKQDPVLSKFSRRLLKVPGDPIFMKPRHRLDGSRTPEQVLCLPLGLTLPRATQGAQSPAAFATLNGRPDLAAAGNRDGREVGHGNSQVYASLAFCCLMVG